MLRASAWARVPLGSVAVVALLGAVHCGSGEDADGARSRGANDSADAGEAAPGLLPFEPVPAESYVAKVKNLLTGLPPTDAELAAVQADPSALSGLVDGWLTRPEADVKLVQFFSNAFQQTAMTAADFTDQIGAMTAVPPALLPNLRESFGRTALEIAKNGAPFNETVTTHSFMMTTALLSFYAFLDVRLRNDNQDDHDKLSPPRTADFVWTAVDDSKEHIELADSLNPSSPKYLRFSVGPSSVLGPVGSQCVPRTFHSAMYSNASVHLFLLEFGTLGKAPVMPAGCPNAYGIDNLKPLLSESDFNDWRMVTITRGTPAAPAPLNQFFDLLKLRKTTSITLDIARVGFFTTPSFFANWQTNVNNQARVTTNQTLITALGQSFSPEDFSVPLSESGLDGEHADPSTACYGCHKNLDPMRQFFRRNFSLTYHEQLDPKETSNVAAFSFGGVSVGGGDNSADAFARILATHPAFPAAWAQKLCLWADSARCSPDDPEFLRVVDAFVASNLDFRKLLKELMASPLVTAAARTKTFLDREPLVSISRYNHFCTALGLRLGLDACHLTGSRLEKEATLLSSNVPADGYSRGSQWPSLVSAPGLFHRSTVENLCLAVATEVIDGEHGKYKSAAKDAAIDDLVSNVMGLVSSDSRAADVKQVLRDHYDAAVAGGAKETEALSSTFVLACTSPLVTGIGL